ncbi:MAG: hypothetical protein LBH84_03035 [Prevotellaceae bacterium]|jgi:hypothetical protein|nr:hypothetical protein [Prevotellaceae bacterium]
MLSYNVYNVGILFAPLRKFFLPQEPQRFFAKGAKKVAKMGVESKFHPCPYSFFHRKFFLGRCIVKVRKQVKDIAIGWPDAAIRAGEKPYSPVKKWA